MEGESLRRSPFAGTWYPADPERLRAMVLRQLEAAASNVSPPPGVNLVALISPHAGLVYSGPVAAAGYRLLSNHDRDDRGDRGGRTSFETVLLLGPSHRSFFEGLALYPRGRFQTPLGFAEVDSELAASLSAQTPRVRDMPGAHRQEHCLEMQLPFLQVVLPRARIVPLIMGDQSGENIDAAARAIAAAVAASSGRVLLVASSDLSHYQSRTRARELDGEVLDCVERFDPGALERLLAVERGHACGGGPMVAVMRAARELGADRALVLRYGDSGDASGETDAVVGYLSAALYGAAR